MILEKLASWSRLYHPTYPSAMLNPVAIAPGSEFVDPRGFAVQLFDFSEARSIKGILACS